ncbi:MAG: type II secretion system F family protein [Candidatus Micrarchaeota archaeon]
MVANSFYDIIGRFFGRERTKRFGMFLSTGGFRLSPERFAGLYVVISILSSLLVALLLFILGPLRTSLFKFGLFAFRPLTVHSSFFIPIFTILISFIFAFGFIALLGYMFVILAADKRRNDVEENLPDFLILAAANARAGMTIDQALWHAAKPEFGILSDEVQVVAKRAFGGVPFGEAIGHLNKSFDSKIVRRTVALIKQGLASGSRVAVILERTAEDARDMQIIKQDISASLLMYVIFIVFAATIGTPFLFAVSAKLVMLMEEVLGEIPIAGDLPATGSMTLIKPQPPIVSSEQFFIFVLLSLLITSVTASLLIGVIRKGNKREGIKYIPFILITGVALFFLVVELIGNFVRGLGGG